MEDNRKLRAKRIISLVSLFIVAALMLLATWFFIAKFAEIRDAENFRAFVRGYGAKAVFVALGLQILQVFVALIPGEAVEIGMGYAFGALAGTLLCFLGVLIASSAVFLLVKKFGTKLIDLFYSTDKLHELHFIKKYVNDRDRLRKITFFLFFIPGTPKDVLTYLYGLTPLSLGEFLAISMIARIPSVVTSTVGGMLVHNGQYAAAAVLFVLTAAVSLAGYLGYQHHTAKKAKEKPADEPHDKAKPT